MIHKVTIKQHLFEQSWEDNAKANLQAIVFQTHTVGEKNFEVKLRLEFRFTDRESKDERIVRFTREVSAEKTEVFDDAAGVILKIVETRRILPSASQQGHTELTTPLVDGIRIGSVKEPNKPSEYFLDVEGDQGTFRFLLGDKARLEELRYVFNKTSALGDAIKTSAIRDAIVGSGGQQAA
jgi:hypothetical protein